MEFYSFRFGEMEVAQADAASPRMIATEIHLGFSNHAQQTVESITLTVHVPHDADKTVAITQQEAYGAACRLLRAAADHCAKRDVKQLSEETESNRAFVVKT